MDSNAQNDGKLVMTDISSPLSPRTIKESNADLNIKPTRVPLSPTQSMGGRRTFYDRTFSKLEKGSVRGSIFNLVSSALGGGVLSLSYVFVQSGWAMGLILLCVGFIAGVWSNLMLAKIVTSHPGLNNLDKVAFAAGGDFLRKAL